MPRHIEVWLDGVALSSIGPILVQEVHEDVPALELIEADRPGRNGMNLIGRKRQTLKVTVEAAIRERFDLAYRASVIAQAASWAGFGQEKWLEMSNHPGQRLRVCCTADPSVGAARNYAENIRMEFTAYAVPYWEDTAATKAELTGAENDGELLLTGTVPAPVCLVVYPTEETMTDITISCGEKTITLTGLNVPSTGTLVIDRGNHDIMAIRENGIGRMNARTPDSSDDLFVSPGIVPVFYSADVDCRVVFTAKGRWG